MTHKHIHIDQALPLVRQADKGHNRWHPDLAPAVRIASGSSVEMETLDGLDGRASGLRHRDEAGLHQCAIDENRAGAAFARTAAFLRSGKIQIVAQEVEQPCEWFDGLGDLATIDGRLKLEFRHKGPPVPE